MDLKLPQTLLFNRLILNDNLVEGAAHGESKIEGLAAKFLTDARFE